MSYQYKPDIRRVQHCILEVASRIACTRYYKHFRGTVYRVSTLAQDSESLSWMVVYGRELFGRIFFRKRRFNAHGDWVRNADNFLDLIDIEGETVPRFEFLEEAI